MSATSHENVVPPLPPPNIRMGGAHFASDAAFVDGGVRDVKLLMAIAGLTRRSRILDWGCGAGRLAVGIKTHLGSVDQYTGIDVQPNLVSWASEHLSDEHTRFRLSQDTNARYHPDGIGRTEFDVADADQDVVYAYSVFSHMMDADSAFYLREIRRVLRSHGRAYVTAFVEEGVGETTENPADYGLLQWSGQLHCVRYDFETFKRLAEQAGLRVMRLRYRMETDGQSGILLAPA